MQCQMALCEDHSVYAAGSTTWLQWVLMLHTHLNQRKACRGSTVLPTTSEGNLSAYFVHLVSLYSAFHWDRMFCSQIKELKLFNNLSKPLACGTNISVTSAPISWAEDKAEIAAQLSRGNTAVAMATFKKTNKQKKPGNPDLALQWVLPQVSIYRIPVPSVGSATTVAAVPPEQNTPAYRLRITGLLKCLPRA